MPRGPKPRPPRTDLSEILRNRDEKMEEAVLDNTFDVLNRMQDNVESKGKTRYDELTFMTAMEYVRKNKPNIVFLGLGLT